MTFGRPGGGITMRLPHKMQSFCILNSSLQCWKGFMARSSVICQPCSTNLRTLESRGSRSVHVLIWAAVVGESCKYSINKTVSAGTGISLGASGIGNLLRRVCTGLVLARFVANVIVIGTWSKSLLLYPS